MHTFVMQLPLCSTHAPLHTRRIFLHVLRDWNLQWKSRSIKSAFLALQWQAFSNPYIFVSLRVSVVWTLLWLGLSAGATTADACTPCHAGSYSAITGLESANTSLKEISQGNFCGCHNLFPSFLYFSLPPLLLSPSGLQWNIPSKFQHVQVQSSSQNPNLMALEFIWASSGFLYPVRHLIGIWSQPCSNRSQVALPAQAARLDPTPAQ